MWTRETVQFDRRGHPRITTQCPLFGMQSGVGTWYRESVPSASLDTPYAYAPRPHSISSSSSLILSTVNEEPGMMRPGHCFTIEVWTFGQRNWPLLSSYHTRLQPCIIQGSNSKIWVYPDGWTVSTEASNPLAHKRTFPNSDNCTIELRS